MPARSFARGRGSSRPAAPYLPPSHNVTPLVDEDGQVAVALDPVAVKVADDALGGRPDGEPLFEFLTSPDSHPRQLRVEGLDDLGLFLQEALGNEKREVGVLVTGGLKTIVEVTLNTL